MGRGPPLLIFLALASGAHGVSPVQKVISLLGDMSKKVEADMEESNHEFETYARYCDKEADAKEHAIADSKAGIEGMNAEITNAQAIIEESDSRIQEVSSQTSDAEAELKRAISIREREHGDFMATERELVETVDSLSRAASVIKKTKSFVQLNSETKKRINMAVQSLSMIVEAAFVTHEQKQRIEAFLQTKEDQAEDDGDDLSVKSTQSDSGGIIEVIEDMQAKAEATLSTGRKEEMNAAHATAMLKQKMESEIASLKEEHSETGAKKSATTEVLATNEKDLAVETKALSETEAFLEELKHNCQTQAADFEVQMKDGQNEIEALSKAKALLEQKFSAAAASFLQTGLRTQLRSKVRSQSRAHLRAKRGGLFSGDDDGEDRAADNKALALRSIEQLGRKLHSNALISLAFRASEDPFGKIRGMIEEMISKLLQEAAGEADQKAFCDKEIGESSNSQASKAEKLDKINARIGNAEAATATLSTEVTRLIRETGEIDSAVRDAIQIRQKEHEGFKHKSKDFSESEEACAAAVQVLQEYYGGASFVQVKMTTHLRSKSRSKAQSRMHARGGEGILGLLEVAESDFATMLAESKASEEAAIDEHKKMVTDNRVLKASLLAEVRGKESELKALKTRLDEQAQDRAGISTELAAVEEYIDKLKPQCESKGSSYAEKKARREQEMEGLKNALSILEGGGIR